uniref:Serine/threonine-protein phosphatase n=1 Tax=Romanomermis culicivorax TaxID=13658 RepID=A0A915L252_ROMCU
MNIFGNKKSKPKIAATAETSSGRSISGGLGVDEILDRLKNHGKFRPAQLFFSGKKIVQKWEFKKLMDELCAILKNEEMLLELQPPINVIADVHGQFLDLIRWLRLCKWPPDASYLFLGDYVDRGPQGAETLCLLAALKIKFPKNIWLLRGNHETANVNKAYGFFDEINVKYKDKQLWNKIQQTFAYLPVAALINRKIFCLHGGLSPDLIAINKVTINKELKAPQISPDHGLLCDLVWSDPDSNIVGWAENNRGISFAFGRNIVRQFCTENKISMIIRGHQLLDQKGYQFSCGSRLLTIFSAPFYCRSMMNDGVSVFVDENMICTLKKLRPSKSLFVNYHLIKSK